MEPVDVGIVAACVVLSLSFVVGVPGNVLVIWTIVTRVKQRSGTVLLILHLAVADLVVLVSLPLWIYALADSWVFGSVLCHAARGTILVCMYGSIFFITLMSAERYLAICRPFLMLHWKVSTLIRRSLVVLWLLAVALGLTAVLTRPVDRNADPSEMCFSVDYSSVSQAVTTLVLETVLGFVLPFITLVTCYCLVMVKLRRIHLKSKQKSLSLVLAVVVVFMVCWLPHHVINTVDMFSFMGSHQRLPHGLGFSAGSLVFINSALNPLLYALFARNFQSHLRETRLVKLFMEMSRQDNPLEGREAQLQMSNMEAEMDGEDDPELSEHKHIEVTSSEQKQ
ncbi:leukotriene B4 receptor 1-like [Neosynchiropus ocellatus]